MNAHNIHIYIQSKKRDEMPLAMEKIASGAKFLCLHGNASQTTKESSKLGLFE